MSEYYRFGNDVEAADIAEHLTGNGAQAVQYVVRSCRLDGKNKGERIGDLEKARWFIGREIERLLNLGVKE
ncbi:DUF3310 domain-containing protein [Corynebacterium striatum]